MAHRMPSFLMIIIVGLCAALLAMAQEEEPVEPAPVEEPAEETTGEPANPVGAVDAWEGEVFLKKAAAEDFELLAPAGEEKAPLYVGDTIRTYEGASITVSLIDGTVIELGPNSELVIEQTPEGLLLARLISGEADVTIASEEFKFVCAHHSVTGIGSRFAVKSPDPDTVTFFGIDEGVVIENEYGLITYLGQGQKIEVIYQEELFKVSVHEYNEMDLKIEVRGEGKLIEPGVVFTVDSDLNIEILGVEEPGPPKEPVVLVIPLELEEPEDEPFEDAGDVKGIHVVSPSKP